MTKRERFDPQSFPFGGSEKPKWRAPNTMSPELKVPFPSLSLRASCDVEPKLFLDYTCHFRRCLAELGEKQ
jgi:hypothetical protein